MYARDGGDLVLREVLPVETAGPATALPAPAPADLLLLNDGDLAFAVVRPDAGSRDALLAAAADLPSALSRTVAVTTAWQLVVLGELPASAFVGCVTRVLATEPAEALVEPFLQLAVTAAGLWSPDADRDALLGAVADTCVALAEVPARRLAAVRALARTATTGPQLAALDRLADRDVDLRWARLRRRAALGLPVDAEVAALRAEDPDPDSAVSALLVRAASADPAAKQEAWDAVAGLTGVPLGKLHDVQQAFWQPSQADLLAPYAERFVELLPQLGSGGMISTMATVGALFPVVGAGEDVLERLREAAAAPGVDPVVARGVAVRSDELRRMLAARG